MRGNSCTQNTLCVKDFFNTEDTECTEFSPLSSQCSLCSLCFLCSKRKQNYYTPRFFLICIIASFLMEEVSDLS